MNPIPAPTQNNDNTNLLIAAVRHATTPELLRSSAADYFGEAIVGPIFNAAPIPVSALEEQKESDSLEPLDNPKGRTIKDLIRLLLADREVNVNVTDSTGWPLIFFAVENVTVLEMLFEARPELTETFSTITAREPNNPESITWDAFTWADSKGCVESLVFLANKLAEPAATAKKREIIRRFLTKDLTQPSNQENFLALLNAFALPAAEMNAVLFEAVKANAGHAISVLLKAPNIEVNAAAADADTDYDDMTALMLAADKGHVEAITELLAAPGINVNAATPGRWTALMYAATNVRAAAITALLKAHGINVNAVDTNRSTALMCAAIHGYADVITALLATPGISVNAFDSDNMTALMIAAYNGNADAISAFIAARDVNVNAANRNGMTALMYAAALGYTAVITALLAAPTLDLNLHNQGREAIALAERNNGFYGCFECAQLIQDALTAAEARILQPQPVAQPEEQRVPSSEPGTLRFSQAAGNPAARAQDGAASVSLMSRPNSRP